jgi:3-phenylpropionate/trans-cinnamate dioxygenase ferredoxin component
VIRVCAVDDLPAGESIRIAGRLGEDAIAVFNVDGDLFAIDDTCTHQDASLADGYLEGDCTVECPLHASCFDLRTGAPTSPPARIGVRTHGVLMRNGTIFVLPSPVAVPGVSA